MTFYECDSCRVRMDSYLKEFFVKLPIKTNTSCIPALQIEVVDDFHVCDQCLFDAIKKHFKALKIE